MAISTSDVIKAFRGLRDIPVKVNELLGWDEKSVPGPFDPVGIMVHHTAGAVTGNAPSLPVCINGRAGLPGPIVQLLIGRDGIVHVISAGRCNHAGMGSMEVLRRVRRGEPPTGDAAVLQLADSVGGNGHFIGIEVEHTGKASEQYTGEAMRSLLAVLAHLCKELGIKPAQIIGHREWTRRKVDPVYNDTFRNMDDLRYLVGRRLVHQPPVTGNADPSVVTAGPITTGTTPATLAPPKADRLFRDPKTGVIYHVEGVRARALRTPKDVEKYLAIEGYAQMDASPGLAELLAANWDDTIAVPLEDGTHMNIAIPQEAFHLMRRIL